MICFHYKPRSVLLSTGLSVQSTSLQVNNFFFTQLPLEGLTIIDSKKHEDDRGYLIESYRKDDFATAGITCEFVQDNQSVSRRGVLRGLHYHRHIPQAKLVRAISGCIYDVAVDLRPDSETFGKWAGVILTEESARQLFIPEGFAHGFFVLSDEAIVSCKCSSEYHPEDEYGLMWNDESLNIAWPHFSETEDFSQVYLVLSEKDRYYPEFNQIKEKLY